MFVFAHELNLSIEDEEHHFIPHLARLARNAFRMSRYTFATSCIGKRTLAALMVHPHAERGQRVSVVGYAQFDDFRRGSDGYRIHSLAVDKEVRRNRVGASLVRTVEMFALGDNAKYIETAPTPPGPAQDFYLSRGYLPRVEENRGYRKAKEERDKPIPFIKEFTSSAQPLPMQPYHKQYT